MILTRLTILTAFATSDNTGNNNTTCNTIQNIHANWGLPEWNSAELQALTDAPLIPAGFHIPVDSGTIPVELTSQIFTLAMVLILQYLYQNSPQNGPESNGTRIHD